MQMLKMTSLVEELVTQVTLMRALHIACLHVSLPIVRLCERHIMTQCHVCSLVYLRIGCLHERLGVHITFIRTLTTMCLPATLQVSRLHKRLLTHIAPTWSFTC